MLAQISRRVYCINGGRTLSFKTLLQFSTAASALKPQKNKNHILEKYLINSLGFSEEEALHASSIKKVTRSNPIKKDFNLIVDFFRNLGLSKTQIKSVVSVDSHLLFNDLDKTLKPKVQALQDIGLSGSDLVKVIMGNKTLLTRGLNSHIKPRIEYLRNLLGTDDNVAVALKRCSFLLGYYAPKKIDENVLMLRKLGFSNEDVTRFILLSPRQMVALNAENFEEASHKVENVLGIPRGVPMFFHGFIVMASLRKSTIDMKREILTSFGWSDVDIRNLFRILPYVLRLSEARMKKALEFFMEELGYEPAYLASHPLLFSLSLEDRVKPRIEIIKILNEKKLNKRRESLYTIVCLPESKFIHGYLQPYKDKIPDVYYSYVKKRQKIKD